MPRKKKRRLEVKTTGRGFKVIPFPMYAGEGTITRLVGESSAVGDYPDSMARPGSSFLWIGEDHHLDREDVRELVEHLQTWLKTGRLA